MRRYIYIHRDGVDYGPYSMAEIHALVVAGRAKEGDWAFTGGTSTWVSLGSILRAVGAPLARTMKSGGTLVQTATRRAAKTISRPVVATAKSVAAKGSVTAVYWVVALLLVACMSWFFLGRATVRLEQLEELGGVTHLKGRTTPFSGQAIGYHANGRMAREVRYRSGKADGTAVLWRANGTKEAEMLFRNGQIVSRREWHQDGKPKAARP